jgi:hypothetical protein
LGNNPRAFLRKLTHCNSKDHPSNTSAHLKPYITEEEWRDLCINIACITGSLLGLAIFGAFFFILYLGSDHEGDIVKGIMKQQQNGNLADIVGKMESPISLREMLEEMQVKMGEMMADLKSVKLAQEWLMEVQE